MEGEGGPFARWKATCSTSDMEEVSPSTTLLAQHKVPIIDIAHITKDLVCPVKSCTRQGAQKLHKALMESGYALLVNHGITEHKLQAAYCKLDTFCSLPEEKRIKYTLRNSSTKDNLYKVPGSKVIGKLHEYKHELDIRNLNQEKLPEIEVPGFTRTINSLIDDFKSLAAVILQFIAIGCDIEPRYFLKHHNNLLSSDDETHFQMIYYPPMDDCKPSNELSSPESNDLGTFTIISQDSEIGLEVLSGNKWIPVGYLPGSLLIRAGLGIHKWTDGYYKPTLYRTVVPDDNSILSRSRHCVLLHVHPENELQIEPISITSHEFQNYYHTEQKNCSFIRAYYYLQRRIRQFCR